MKKLLVLLITLAMLFCMLMAVGATAYADDGVATGESVAPLEATEEITTTEQAESPQEEFFSWGTLATYAGAVLFATLVTQFVKKITWLQKIPTQVICYIVATIGLLAGTYFSGTLTISSAALCLVNGMVVAVAANGT